MTTIAKNNPQASAVACKHLVKTFKQGSSIIKALDDVSLEVRAGEFVCLAGASGSGKSTLLNALGGLDTADSGEISVGNQRVDQLSSSERADLRLNKIGFVFQAYNLIPVLSARENVEFVMQVQGVSDSERKQKSLAILKEVGLEGLEDRRPDELSGGQQQRVAVARAVVSKPQLVLADEPTANLDSKASEQLLQLFYELNQSHGISFIVVSHDQQVIRYAPRVVRMLDGKIIEDSLNADTTFGSFTHDEVLA